MDSESLKKAKFWNAWKIRVLKQDYCGLLTFKNSKPTKCTYCLIHKPYQCVYKVTMAQLLWDELFNAKSMGQSV